MSLSGSTAVFSDRAMRTFSAKVLIVRQAAWANIKKAHPENVMAPIKLGYSVRMLRRRGHHVVLMDTETGAFTPQDVESAISLMKPDVVVVHGITTAVPSMRQTADYVRSRLPNALIVASGQHATARPQDFLHPGSPFHCAPQFEYEEVISDLVEAWSMRSLASVPGLVLYDETEGLHKTPQRPLREDLDTLPFPAHELFMRSEYQVFHPTDVTRRRRWGFMMTSRGCPYPCLYCSPTLRNSYGRKMRFRSAENVVEEMRYLSRLGATVLHFKDDIFTIDHDRTFELCETIQRANLGLSWTVQTRADCVDDKILSAMRAAGCCTVSYGVESGSPRILEVLRKKESVEDAVLAAEATCRAGLLMVNFYLLGNPTETVYDMEMTLELAKRLDPDLLQVGFFTPYPGSPYYEEVFCVKDDLPPDSFSHYNKVINLSEVPTDQLMAFQKRFYREIILRPGFAARFVRNRLRGLPNNLRHELRFFDLSARFLLKSVRRGLSSL
jgi:radical SAM superfamily enzyme YgiQ (UPF0313 family)